MCMRPRRNLNMPASKSTPPPANEPVIARLPPSCRAARAALKLSQNWAGGLCDSALDRAADVNKRPSKQRAEAEPGVARDTPTPNDGNGNTTTFNHAMAEVARAFPKDDCDPSQSCSNPCVGPLSPGSAAKTSGEAHRASPLLGTECLAAPLCWEGCSIHSLDSHERRLLGPKLKQGANE